MNLPSLNLGGSASASVGAGAGASAAGRAAALARLSPAASPAAGPKPAGAGAPRPDPVIGLNFDLKVEDGAFKLGTFTACEGLGAEYEIMAFEEGGENGVVHQLPGRKKYTNVKLTRPLDHDSVALATWFSQFEPSHRTTALIIALGPDRKALGHWSLIDVFPVRWTGPQFRADGSAVVTESIELAHGGFTGFLPGAGT